MSRHVEEQFALSFAFMEAFNELVRTCQCYRVEQAHMMEVSIRAVQRSGRANTSHRVSGHEYILARRNT